MNVKNIVIEGIDASGKSEACVALKDRLRMRKTRCDLYKSPSHDGPVGELIREVFHGVKKVHPMAMAHLFMADEIDQESFVATSLRAGTHVIRDRHSAISGPVYQSEGNVHPMRALIAMMPVGLFKRVDLVVLLDCDPRIALERRMADNRPDRNTGTLYQDEDLEKLGRLRERYMAQRYMHDDLVDKWLVLDTGRQAFTPGDIARLACMELDI